MFIKKNYCSNSNEYTCFIFLLIFLLILSGCQSNNKPSSKKQKQSVSTVPPANDDYFQEIGKEIGLDFIQSIGDDELTNIVESSGGGAAFLDYDQDGYIDLYICSGTWSEGLSGGEKPDKLPGNHLYHNRQDGTFEDVTKKAGVGGPWYSMGVTVGDYN
ncbi:MAG: VCBS repeat-containing protein, partial [Actinobacteria bacterium]|nr:VCBS repeat-containing protein [Actinomycetota bacterium]